MPEINKPLAYRVSIIESERGWGQRLDEEKYFNSEVEAKAFCVEYNRQNNKEQVPDWYMYASYDGKL